MGGRFGYGEDDVKQTSKERKDNLHRNWLKDREDESWKGGKGASHDDRWVEYEGNLAEQR